jgi:hypothetical protein
MKLAIAALLLFGAITQTNAQQTLGFSPSDTPGPSIKLDGLIMHPVMGGYMAMSVPPKDIMMCLAFVAKMDPHIAVLEALERLDRVTRKLTPAPGPVAVPIGKCFLATNEVFPRHKIINRYVQMVGTYTYLDLHGEAVTVPAYSGGPTK